MTTTQVQNDIRHMGETKAMANHDHDMVQELSKVLDSIWRYDQYIANAEADEDLKSLWQDCKEKDMKIVERLKEKIADHVKNGCW